jgi:small-conductance mechanosensitive channel
MIKWLTKQFIWGQIYHWAKDRLSGILFTTIILFLIIYFHNEYLKYIEFKEKNSGNYIGISFLIKNTLILIVTFSYFYFYKFLNKAKDLITKKEEQFELKSNNDIIKPTDNNEMVDNLDRFLEDDELNR